MNDYVFLFISIVAAVCNNIILHLLLSKNIKYNPFLFNIGVSLVWIIILLPIGVQGRYTGTTVLYGVVYGLLMAGFLFFKMQAMTTGPILLTSLLGCSSFVLTTVFNAVYWKESIDVFGVTGILLMLVALYLITMKDACKPQTDGREKGTRVVWIVYCLFFLLFAASTGIIFKFHQTYDKGNTNKMMVVSAVVSVITFLSLYCLSKIFLKQGKTEEKEDTGNQEIRVIKRERYTLLGLMLAAGVVSCVYNRLNVYLTGVLPSVLFFPVFNGAVIMLASVAGIFVFKEKLTKRQGVGVGCGILAIILISHFFGVFN